MAALLFLLVALPGCAAKGPREHLFSGPTMGTSYHVKLVTDLDESTILALERTIQETLTRVNARMSTYQADSELSRFNQSEETTPLPLSDETLGVFEIAQAVSRETGGAFDVTVGPLVNAWGFGPDAGDPPGETALEKLRRDVGYELLTLDRAAGTLAKARPGVYCDLSAVAKGYAVDAVAEVLEAGSVSRYMVEVGGEVRTAGANGEGQPWRIGVYRPDPESFELQRVVALSGLAMATSGDYRNFIDVDGTRLSHTIDPRTGRPASHGVASVSVVHTSCAWADAYATALMVLPPEAGFAFAEKHQIAAYFIIHEGEQGFTEHLSTLFRAL